MTFLGLSFPWTITIPVLCRSARAFCRSCEANGARLFHLDEMSSSESRSAAVRSDNHDLVGIPLPEVAGTAAHDDAIVELILRHFKPPSSLPSLFSHPNRIHHHTNVCLY